MAKRYSWFDASREDPARWRAIAPPGEYRVVKPATLPTSAIASGLLAKADAAVVMCSTAAVGGSAQIYTVTLTRVDAKASAVDQEPFVIAFNDGTPMSGGVIRHHGDWPGRTTHPPAGFWSAIETSGIGNCQPLAALPPAEAGPMSDLEEPATAGHGARWSGRCGGTSSDSALDDRHQVAERDGRGLSARSLGPERTGSARECRSVTTRLSVPATADRSRPQNSETANHRQARDLLARLLDRDHGRDGDLDATPSCRCLTTLGVARPFQALDAVVQHPV